MPWWRPLGVLNTALFGIACVEMGTRSMGHNRQASPSTRRVANGVVVRSVLPPVAGAIARPGGTNEKDSDCEPKSHDLDCR